jgi:hypothetical protein
MLRCIKEVNIDYIKKAGITIFNRVGLPISCGIKEVKHGKAFIDMKDIYSESIRRGSRRATELGEYFVRFESSDGLVTKMDLWIKGKNTGLVSIWLSNLYIKI